METSVLKLTGKSHLILGEYNLKYFKVNSNTIQNRPCGYIFGNYGGTWHRVNNTLITPNNDYGLSNAMVSHRMSGYIFVCVSRVVSFSLMKLFFLLLQITIVKIQIKGPDSMTFKDFFPLLNDTCFVCL